MRDDQHRVVSEVFGIFQEALNADSVECLQRIVDKCSRLLGFEKYGYAQKRASTEDGYRYFHNFHDEWGAQYRALNSPEAERFDPRIIQAKRWLPASGWDSLGRYSHEAPEYLRPILTKRLRWTGEFGIHSGITVPLRAPGIEWAFMSFTLGHRVPIRDLDPTLLSATYFANCLQAALAKMSMGDPAHRKSLTARELDVLHWAANGKTSWEMSMIMNISEATVNFHIRRAAEKLGVRGRRAAIARAIVSGLLRI